MAQAEVVARLPAADGVAMRMELGCQALNREEQDLTSPGTQSSRGPYTSFKASVMTFIFWADLGGP